jgi:hypothetical protein
MKIIFLFISLPKQTNNARRLVKLGSFYYLRKSGRRLIKPLRENSARFSSAELSLRLRESRGK